MLQWAAVIFTFMILPRIIRGKSTNEKKAGMAFVLMMLLLNVGYLFELMADDRSAAFLALQIEYAGFIFSGYFICLFFIFYAKRQVPSWMGVYTLVFDMLILVVTWTSNWHELVFKNVRYELVNGKYELLYDHGELYMLILLGCGVAPLVLAFIMVVMSIGNEWVARLRRQTILMALLLFASFGCVVAFFGRVLPLQYNIEVSE